MDKMKIDILGISKIRWPKSVDFWSKHHKIIHTGASEKIPGTRGVRIIMNKTLGKKVKGYIQYDDRIILVKFQAKPKNIIVVQVYMSTINISDEEEENLVIMCD